MQGDRRIFRTAFIAGLGFAAGVLTLAGIALVAQSVSTFSSGQVVSAAEMNANFAILNGKLTILDTNHQALDARVTTAEASITRIAPVGTILAWHKSLGGVVPPLPVGWVECNGQTLVDGASLLNGQVIPNLNGTARFLRGAAVSGTLQAHAFQGHRHYRNTINQPEHNMITGFNSGGGQTFVAGAFAPVDQLFTGNAISDGVNGTPLIAAETRPVNMSVVWVMRVR